MPNTEPYRGPSIFERAIAARRLAWLTRQLPQPLLSDSHATTLLPLLLAAADDPSPAVQRSGQLGLLHLAQVAQHGSLSWQRELLLDFCERMVAGCDEGVWDSALAAAAALVQVRAYAELPHVRHPLAAVSPVIATITCRAWMFVELSPVCAAIVNASVFHACN